MAPPALRFCANLTLMFNEVDFLERFGAAARAGFGGVEFHFPYPYDKEVIAEVLLTSGVEAVLFNLPAGDWAAGDRGCACQPARRDEFRDGVGRAIDYAAALGCRRLNCLAGIPDGERDEALSTLVDNLRFAVDAAGRAGVELLLEPLNGFDHPGFLLQTPQQALQVLHRVGDGRLRLLYDVYHAQRMVGELARSIDDNLALIGHVQIADNPGRGQPGSGEVNFPFLFSHLQRRGYSGWIGCEYRPVGGSEDSLGWLQAWRKASAGKEQQ